MTEAIASLVEQFRLFVVHHVPTETLKEALPFGLLCLLAGTGISVLGTKLARYGMTCAFVLLGGYMGVFCGRQASLPVPVCGMVGALMFGVIGYQTFRVWVGAVAAMVVSAAALGAFAYQRVLPHMAEFEQGRDFVVPTQEQQQNYRNRTPTQWADELWTFVTDKDPQAEPMAQAVAVGGATVGMFLGVLAVRWALILATSLIGTGLVTTALATMLTRSAPESLKAFERHPGLIGIGIGGFLVTSLIVQTLLTRALPSGKGESKAKS